MNAQSPILIARKSPAEIGHWLMRQLLIIIVIALGVALGLILLFGQRPGPTLIYCFTITACCAVFVQALRLSAARLMLRWRPGDESLHEGWPGWPLMLISLLIGTIAGYSAGVELGNWITGFKESGVLNSGLRRGLSIMLISLVPGLGLTFYFVHRGRLSAAEARAQTAQRQAAEHQLRLLESQLEPHMLFNTLANLRVLIGMDPPRAQQMLDQLIGFLRATLTASRSGMNHSLREEFTRIADYLALLQLRMGARLRPVLELPAELAELPVPPLLLQPLVENAIKHGLEPSIAGGELRVSARLAGERLVLEVRDGGVGLQAPAGDGTRFGLHQVRERLATRYGSAAALSLAPAEPAGTVATITLPLP
ncbi:sensor histidine kinase [Roseateles violae]|uniref:Histidine kinase n=1 Tax=Roseateles violae TaxID=3058042 RepID=A0ABT8DNB8_9BURK|nr:histidine kinase [Pelomonas sp. PFR6]MDN3919869.1 histidine kinase [Pelomonas sp. PFR6]